MLKVHYIGTNTYNAKSFAKEAHEYGVSRAMPVSLIKKMDFGDKVFLAENIHDKTGEANIFGGFTVGGFTPMNISEIEMETLMTRLTRKVNDNKTGEYVMRLCGRYQVVSVGMIDNPDINKLSDCINTLKDINPDAKVLLTGKYFDINPVQYGPLFQTRGITFADNISEVDVTIKGNIQIAPTITNIDNYKRY